MADFSGKVVLVTGAAGNLGSAVAQAFRASGAALALVDRSAEPFAALFPEWRKTGRLFFLTADLTDMDSTEAMVQSVVDHFGRLDVLANTVGGYRAGTTVPETPLAEWNFMFTLNARTAFNLSRAVIPVMLHQGYGKVIHTAAQGGLHGTARAAGYAASKAAVIRLTESLADEVRGMGINVNCVMPSTMNTPQNREAMPKADFTRWVKPEAIAEVFLFLASDAASAIHGAAIPVYGTH